MGKQEFVYNSSSTNKIEIPAYFVPETIKTVVKQVRIFETDGERLVLQYPDLRGETIEWIAKEVDHARATYLTKRTINEIVHAIDLAIQKWLNPEYPLRQLAERWLPVITGYHGEVVRLELKRLLRTFRKKELLRFLDEEFDQPQVLDEFRPRKSGGMSRAFGPDLIFHVFSGNVPGLPIWSLIMGLLVKSASIGKTSSAEPLMAVLFAQSLREVDPEMAATIAILPWKGGTAELEDPLLEKVETVIAYGSDESIAHIRAKLPAQKRFLSYGHKVSFAMIGKEALTADRYRDTLRRLADDVATYDQQGCVSPHSVFVEQNDVVDAKQFAQLLAAELQRYQVKRPRANIQDEEALAIQHVRTQYELEQMKDTGNSEIEVFASLHGTDWTVIYHGQPGFAASPLNRTIHVFCCQLLDECIQHLLPFRRYLQTAGVAVPPWRLQSLAEHLGAAGVNRISAIGQMAHTQAGWHHDGRFNLIDLVRWTDIEWTAERDAERYDPDVE